ncbi:MAG TPA: prepilin-type N-terminal cleavage/methylation domain-containing protein [Gemmatimonadales bacterium]|nr:prepilin-type N-terminal cleavage/methylation domain-containing protein [Gemmatimonadales bacterium]
MTNERGFTLIEVVVALTILLVVIVGFVTTTGKTTNVAATSERQEMAMQLVSDRIDQIRSDPDYGGLDTTYGGSQSNFATLPGYTRTTQIVRTTASGNDYKRVTVSVTGPGLSSTVSRTITVGAQ